MKEIERLKMLLIALKEIDAKLVAEVEKELFADGKITREEVQFMYNMNREVAFKTVDSSWKDLYAKVMTSYVLDDEKSPGVIDDEEAKIVEDIVKKDKAVYEVEHNMLTYLKAHVKDFPSVLEALI